MSDSLPDGLVPAYEGLVVVDLSRRLSGAFVARLFADHGADVVMLEPPGGHPLRREAPFLNDESGPERSALHAYANWNKRSAVIADPSEAEPWIAGADVAITTDGPEALASWPLSGMRSDAVHLSVTPFGLDGPLANATGGNLTINARCGWAYINAMQDEAPVTLPSRQAGIVGGLAAFVAGSAALRRRWESQLPEVVDIREMEALTHTGYPWSIGAIYQGMGWSRGAAGGRPRGEPGSLFDAVDGRMNFGFGDWHNWQQAMELFNLPDQGARAELHPHDGRYSKDLEPVRAGVARELAQIEKWPLFHSLAKLRCISGVLQTIPELVEHEQLLSRNFIVETELDGETVRASGNPHPISPPSWSLRSPAPTLGSDSEGPLTPKAAEADAAQANAVRNEVAATATGPLDGVRILTFTQAWSGTFCTELLGFLGADVVQIEALQRVDIWRTVGPRVPSAIQDDSKQQHTLNTQGLYNAVNLNKRAITLDLRSDEGKELFWRMVPQFDVVAENFRPGVLDGWGITLDALAKQRADIILARISGYGITGPYAPYPANGATTEPMSGLSSIHGYEDEPGMNTGGLYPDPITGYSAASAIIAAIARRDRVGGPQEIDVAMLEAMGVVVGDAIAEYDATGRTPGPLGNHDRQRAPHNIYPCSGDDEWVAFSVESDDEWRSLCLEMDAAGLSEDARFIDAASRKANESALDTIVAQWTSAQDSTDVERRLLAMGIDAARVNPMYDLFDSPDPYLESSGFIQSVDHREVGPSWLPGAPWRFSGSEDRLLRPAPCVGEHSFEVLSQELGISEAEYRSLVERRITGTLYEAAAAAATAD